MAEEEDWTRLMPEPGNYTFPLMKQTRITGTEDPAVLQLHFSTERSVDGQVQKLTMAVPISGLDAAGLLRSLRMLEQRGIVPFVPDTPKPDRPS